MQDSVCVSVDVVSDGVDGDAMDDPHISHDVPLPPLPGNPRKLPAQQANIHKLPIPEISNTMSSNISGNSTISARVRRSPLSS